MADPVPTVQVETLPPPFQGIRAPADPRLREMFMQKVRESAAQNLPVPVDNGAIALTEDDAASRQSGEAQPGNGFWANLLAALLGQRSERPRTRGWAD